MAKTNSVIKYGWLRAVLCFVFFLMLFVLVSGLLQKLTGKHLTAQPSSSISQTWQLLGSVIVVNLCFFSSAALFRKLIDRRTFYSLGFKLSGQSAAIGLLTGISVVGLGTLILWLIGDIKFAGAHFEPLLFFLNVVIFGLVALGEELFFRGYILNNLMQSFNKWLALAISAVFFMLLHMQNAGASASQLPIVSVFIGGVLFGIAYIFTQNLWYGIALHFIWNFLQGPVLGYDVSGTASRPVISQTMSGPTILTGGVFGFEGSIICILFSLIAIAILTRLFKLQSARRNIKPCSGV